MAQQAAHGSGSLWPDIGSARRFLAMLVGRDSPSQKPFVSLPVPKLAQWLTAQGLGPMAYARFKEAWPELTQQLRGDAIVAALEQKLHEERRARILAQFGPRGIPLVLLKGGALSLTVYDEPSWRPMSDMDIWVRDEQMAQATGAMREAGFQMRVSASRSLAMQELVEGELQFSDDERGLVELHWSPFTGWWLYGAAAVDRDGAWKRIEPIRQARNGADQEASEYGEQTLYRLCWEDFILQLVVHVSVGHKFGIWPVRSLIDIYLIAIKEEVDWVQIMSRAYAWRLQSVTWMVLSLVYELLELPALDPVVRAVEPSPMRRRLLQALMPVEKLLADSDMREQLARLGLLILLVDRPRDMARLAAKMVWPDRVWLEARYGEARASNWRHLWHLVRRRALWE